MAKTDLSEQPLALLSKEKGPKRHKERDVRNAQDTTGKNAHLLISRVKTIRKFKKKSQF